MISHIKLSCRFATATLLLVLAGGVELRAQEPKPARPGEAAAASQSDPKAKPKDKKKKSPAPKGTSGGGFTGALGGIADAIGDSEAEPEATPEKDPAGPAVPGFATSMDPKTGIATASLNRGDGSRIVTRTDRDGNVVSTELIPPPGQGPSIASTTDPATGIRTTVTTEADGTRTVTKTETRHDPDGTQHTSTTDDKGSRTETVVKPDGTTTTYRAAADGETVSCTQEPDGTMTLIENHAGDAQTTTTRDADGKIVTEKLDAKGNKIETVTRLADGSETRIDEQGNVTKTSAPDAEGKITETFTDRRGNSTTITRDATGEVIARDEQQATPKEPGQEYYEEVLGGAGQWKSLPGSMKTRYADSELQMRDAEATKKLRASQDEQQAREDEAMKKAYAERKAKTDEKLTAIQAEQDEADRKSAARIAQEERQRQIEESYEKAAELQRKYDAAVQRGDMAEARRILKKQDEHHDAGHSLLAFNEEETRAMERKQALRDEIANQLFGSAREEALRKDDQNAAQALKEGVTDVTKWALTGSEMQQMTQVSTRQANRQLDEAQFIRRGLEKIINDPKTSPEKRDIAGNMLQLCEAKERGAYEQLASNSNLTAAGYAIDAASLVAGGPLSKLAAKALGTAGTRTMGQIGLAATRRVAGEEVAHALGHRAAAVADKARGVAKYVADSKAGTVLSTDAGRLAQGQIAQAESKYLKDFATDIAKGTVVGAGAQVAMTGDVDPESLIKSALGGAILNRAVSGRIKPEAVSHAAPNVPDQPISSASSVGGNVADNAAPGARALRPKATTQSSQAADAASKPSAPRLADNAPAPRPQPEAPPSGKNAALAKDSADASRIASTRTEPVSAEKPAPDTADARPIPPPTRDRIGGPSRKNDPPSSARDPESGAVAKNSSITDEPTTILHDNQKPVKSTSITDEPTTILHDNQKAVKSTSIADEPTTILHDNQRPVKSAPRGNDSSITPEAPSTGSATADTRTSLPKGTDFSTRLNPPEKPARSSTGETPERIRNSLEPKDRDHYDKSMAVVDQLIKADPRFAKADRNALARAAVMRAGHMEPEAVAAFALNYHGPEGARITPQTLADATGLSKVDAERLVRSGWNDVGLNPKDIHDPGPSLAGDAAAVPNPVPASRADTRASLPGRKPAPDVPESGPADTRTAALKPRDKPPEVEEFDPSEKKSVSQLADEAEAAQIAGEEVLNTVKGVNTDAEKFAAQHPWRDADDPSLGLADVNCFSAAAAAEQRLAGVPAELSKALPSTGAKRQDSIDALQSRYDTPLVEVKAKQLVKTPGGELKTKDVWLSGPAARNQIQADLRAAGKGARGIIGVDLKGGDGHAFNVVNHKGQIVFVDAQSGELVNAKYWQNVTKVRWIRTDSSRTRTSKNPKPAE